MLRPGADPRGALAELVDRINRTNSDEALSEIGCGDLESLLMQHEEVLWDEIEAHARSNVRFRRALRSVWHFESPWYQQRERLMFEFGEWRPVALSFVAFNESLDGEDWHYRALEKDSSVTDEALAQVLRLLADRLESPPPPRPTPGPPRFRRRGPGRA